MRDLNKNVKDNKDILEAIEHGKIVQGYVQLNNKYRLTSQYHNFGQVIQYATYYFVRLNTLKEKVIEQAKKKWEGQDLNYVKDILDIKYDTKTVIAGTLYKEMIKKPSILNHLDGVLGQRKPRNYCSDKDVIILEDSSGRIRIKSTPGFTAGDVITGTVVALRGEADLNGIFHIDDWTFAGYF